MLLPPHTLLKIFRYVL
jgi:hypothetical protein